MTAKDPWLVSGDEVKVSIESLKSFADALQKELEVVFLPSFNAGIKPLMSIQAPMGGQYLNEGKWARARHTASVDAVLQMCAEAKQGLMALQMAALSIATEYMSGDAISQAGLEDVNEAFAPLEGNLTLQGILNGTQELPAAYGNEDPPVPEGMDNPESYSDFQSGDNGGNTSSAGTERPEGYGSQTYGTGTGAYTVEADNDGTWDPHVNRQIGPPA